MDIFGVISAGAGAAVVQVIALTSFLIISECYSMSRRGAYDFSLNNTALL